MRVSRIHRHQRTHMSSSKFCIVCFKGDCDLQLEENCEHCFHSACIRKWVSSNGKTCPACFQHIRAAKDVTTPEMKLNRCCFFVALFLAYILVVSWASTFGVAKTNATVIFTPSTGKDVMLYDFTHAPSYGKTFCAACPGNTYSASAASACTACPTGTTANAGHTACA